jgi:MFS family permease
VTLSPPPPRPAQTHSTRLVLLLLLVASVGYLCRTAITVVAPGIAREFHLTGTQVGLLFSAFLAGYTICQVPSGWLADRVSARNLFLALCLGWAILTCATAAVPGTVASALVTLIAVRALFGVVAAPTYPASARTIAASIAPEAQARANGVVLASIGIGSAVTPFLVGGISERAGWRTAMYCAAGLSAIVAMLWWRLAPNAGRDADGNLSSGGIRIPGNKEPGAASYISAENSAEEDVNPLRGRSFWFLSASYFLQGYVGYIFVFWFYLYLREVRHFSFVNAAGFTALPMITSVAGIPLGGVLSDLAVKRWGPTWGRRSLPMAALCAAAVFLVMGARAESAVLAAISLSACTVLVLCTEGPFWATVNHLAGRRGGTAGGLMNFGSNLGGMISPTLTPWLGARIGWASALTVAAALAALSGLLWMGVTLPKPGRRPAGSHG